MLAGGLEQSGQRNAGDPTIGPHPPLTNPPPPVEPVVFLHTPVKIYIIVVTIVRETSGKLLTKAYGIVHKVGLLRVSLTFSVSVSLHCKNLIKNNIQQTVSRTTYKIAYSLSAYIVFN